jgi:predicted ATP-grasp superfamily ATP-dependent carboligase
LRIFVYEFVSGGGLLGTRSEAIAESLLAEGRAMRAALASDFAILPGFDLQVLSDDRYRLDSPQVDVQVVRNEREHDAAFDRLAGAADWTIVIAPEINGQLERYVRRVITAGGRVLGPSPEVIALTSDKHRLSTHLRANGVQAPDGALLNGRGDLPADFTYPAVLKPIDGAGSLGVRYMERVSDAPEQVDFNASRWRLEKYCPGMPMSVAILCGPHDAIALPACHQRLTNDGQFQYLGGSIDLRPASMETQRRMQRLASQAVATLGATAGYLGVDLILGEDERRDVVIEINPRLTTSYIGLRVMCQSNLAAAMLQAAAGESPSVPFREGTLTFDADGRIGD